MASFFSGGTNRWFGFKLGGDKTEDNKVLSPIPELNHDGAVTVTSDSYSIAYNVDLNNLSERELVDRYRSLAIVPEVRFAIENIVNEAIVIDDGNPVKLNISGNSLTDSQRKNISAAWDNVLRVLDFNSNGYNIFERWYIDGKIYYYIIIDTEKGGIKEVRQMDPRCVKKVRSVHKKMNDSGVSVIDKSEEYFVYANSTGSNGLTQPGIKLSVDSVAYAHSGLLDVAISNDQFNGSEQTPVIKSYLHTAIKPANQLQMLEESIVIYRMVRAPERRAFYIDVDGLPNGKADQHVRDTMNRFKNKTSYDVTTGAISDTRRHMAMIEDFFLPRRNGKSTEITTLPGGAGLGEINDIDYFKDKLIASLNIPRARFSADAGFQLGKTDTVSRDEITFNKFITKLRIKFNDIFYSLLKVQLVSSGLIQNDDETWEKLKPLLSIEYSVDNYFSTLKEIEILSDRLDVLSSADNSVGKYLSKQYVFEKILGFTQEEIDQIQKDIEKEAESDQSNDRGDDFGGNDFGGGPRFGDRSDNFGSEYNDDVSSNRFDSGDFGEPEEVDINNEPRDMGTGI